MIDYFQYTDKKTLDQKIANGIFPFNKNLFWDADVENIDMQKHKRYITERVLTRGFTDDVYALIQIYSVNEIKESLRKSKELDPKTIHFCSWYFNLDKSEMHVSSFYH